MTFANMKIGVRLGLGFGVVQILMVFLLMVAVGRMDHIGSLNKKILDTDWVKADAASTINVLTRANARRTLELFIESDPVAITKIYAQIDSNKRAISDAFALLEKLVYSPEGKALLAKTKSDRAQYVQSFGLVGKLLTEDKRDDAVRTMKQETLPALDVLEGDVKELSTLQKKLVGISGLEVGSTITSASQLLIGLGLVSLIVSIVIGYTIVRSITGPLRRAVTIAQAVAAGDLSSRIDVTSKDETGQMLAALEVMNSSLIHIVSQVRSGTDTIATASGEIAEGNLDLSSRTEDQASSLEETAASMEELTSTVKQNADNARQANQLALDASEVAVRGGALVLQVVGTMESISASSKKIVDIISVIDSIAFQTNILALNAAVEAARAGEQGRGFAVVASEVRNLAHRSAAAAKEIKSLIDASVKNVDGGSKLVNQAGETMNDIVSSIAKVTDIMGDITNASIEQSDGIEQINQAIMQMDDVTQQNAALVEEAAAVAQSLQDQAATLVGVVSIFTLQQGASPALVDSGATGSDRPSGNAKLASVTRLGKQPVMAMQMIAAPGVVERHALKA
ncbi:methyl-accepting chemotaxis protein [soil metagenome]